jgi:hypothetical protein
MHLNLAQAEVKYAWELSRQQDVSHIDEKFRNVQRHYWLPAAAAFVIFALGTVLSLQLFHLPNAGGNTIAKQTIHSLTKENTATTQPLQTKSPVQEPAVIASERVSPVTAQGNNSAVASLSTPNKPAAQKRPALPEVSGSVPVNSESEPVKTAASNPVQNVRTSENATGVKPQPVSGMSIDEEALTREASNSLRLGK